MIYLKKHNKIFEFNNKKELYSEVGIYIISQVGIIHSYKKTLRHYGDVGLYYYNRFNRLRREHNILLKGDKIDFEFTGYSIFDEKGIYYSALDFVEYYEEYLNKFISEKYDFNSKGPVPGTGKRNYCGKLNYTSPKMFNEIRNNSIIKENEEPKIRSKRRSERLSFNLYFCQEYRKESRSWKKFRNTQRKGD